MSPVEIAASEHVGALGPADALRSLRRGLPADAREHLAEILERVPTVPERAQLARAIRTQARAAIRSLLDEARLWAEPEDQGIDVEDLERALAQDDTAEPVHECSECDDRGHVLTRDDEGMTERETCSCSWPASKAAA